MGGARGGGHGTGCVSGLLETRSWLSSFDFVEFHQVCPTTSVGRGLACSCAQVRGSSDVVLVVVLRHADLCYRTSEASHD